VALLGIPPSSEQPRQAQAQVYRDRLKKCCAVLDEYSIRLALECLTPLMSSCGGTRKCWTSAYRYRPTSDSFSIPGTGITAARAEDIRDSERRERCRDESRHGTQECGRRGSGNRRAPQMRASFSHSSAWGSNARRGTGRVVSFHQRLHAHHLRLAAGHR